jgi:hypothetical protein
VKNPQDVANKWAARLASATDAIRQGVQSVTVSPTQKAAQRTDSYLSGVQRAVTSGKYQRGLQRVSLADWQNAMLNKGLPRVASGAAAAKDKMTAFMSKFLPYVDGLQAKLANQPRGDLSQNIARMVTAVEYMAAFKNT